MVFDRRIALFTRRARRVSSNFFLFLLHFVQFIVVMRGNCINASVIMHSVVKQWMYKVFVDSRLSIAYEQILCNDTKCYIAIIFAAVTNKRATVILFCNAWYNFASYCQICINFLPFKSFCDKSPKCHSFVSTKFFSRTYYRTCSMKCDESTSNALYNF